MSLRSQYLTKYKQKYPLLLGCLAMILFTLAFVSSAQAQTGQLISGIGPTLVSTVIGYVLGTIKDFVFTLITISGLFIKLNLSTTLTNVTVVRNLWEIVRNFANMFFILGLIVMAFGTIFSLRKYEFRSLILNFILAALLINFSLSIGEFIIVLVQSLNNVFITAIGDVGARFAQGAKFGNLFAQNLQTTVAIGADAAFLKATISAFASLILSFVALFSLIVLAVFTFIRIPIIWALLIVSPFAWITLILPNTRRINQMWWKYFLGWNMFLPLYLFFIYFGLYIVQQGESILPTTVVGDINKTLMPLNILVQDLFFYALSAVFIIGGAKYAMRTAMDSGAGGVALGIWGKGVASARFAGRFAARPVSVPAGYASKAIQERATNFQQRVFTEPGQNLGARIAGGLGAQKLSDETMSKAVTGAKIRLQKETDPNKLRLIASQSANTNEKIAALELIEERFGGLQTAAEVKELYNLYGGDSSQNARKALDKIDPKKFSKADRDELYAMGDLRLKQKIVDVRAEKGDFTDENDFIRQSTIFTSEGDKIDFARKAKDYLERLKPDQRRAIFFNDLTSVDMKREISTILAEKGDFKGIKDSTGKVIKTSEQELSEVTKLLYESPSQQEAFLNKAKKKHLMEALRVKKSLLKLSEEDYQKEKTREIARLDNPEILDLTTESLEDEEFTKELAKTLNQKRIAAITINPKADGSKLAALAPVFAESRRLALETEKLEPLAKHATRIKSLVAEVLAARTSNDTQKISQLNSEAEAIRKKAEKLSNEILGSEFAETDEKNRASQHLTDINNLLNSLKRP